MHIASIHGLQSVGATAPAPVQGPNDYISGAYIQQDMDVVNFYVYIDRLYQSGKTEDDIRNMKDLWDKINKIDEFSLDPYYWGLLKELQQYRINPPGTYHWKEGFWRPDMIANVIHNITIDWKKLPDIQSPSDKTMIDIMNLVIDAGSRGNAALAESLFTTRTGDRANGGQWTPAPQSYARFYAFYLTQHPDSIWHDHTDLLSFDVSRTTSPNLYAFFHGTTADPASGAPATKGVAEIFADVKGVQPSHWNDDPARTSAYGDAYYIEYFAHHEFNKFINPSAE